MESLLDYDDEESDSDSDSPSSSSLAPWDSDSEFQLSPEPSDVSVEDAVLSDVEKIFSGHRAKRRRLARAKERHTENKNRFGLFPAASYRTAASDVTLIILDWDDTLLPSTWLQQNSLTIVGPTVPTVDQRAVLAKVSKLVIKTLRRAKRLGQVIIITNGEKGWVELSCSKFLPGVLPLLEGIKILSARSTFEHAHQQSPIDWKRLAFLREIGTFFRAPSQFDEACPKNTISIGDSMQERIALLEATTGEEYLAKSIKFEERPSPDKLMKQHRFLRACLRPLVDFEGSLDLCLQIPN
jgi:hypothetical protein